jgi:hypothetical protein
MISGRKWMMAGDVLEMRRGRDLPKEVCREDDMSIKIFVI